MYHLKRMNLATTTHQNMFRISNLIDLDLVFYRCGFSWGGEVLNDNKTKMVHDDRHEAFIFYIIIQF